MPTKQTQLFPPPLRGSELPPSIQKWLLTLQLLLPLRSVDTSGGSYSENVPAAGLNATTGQSNQNQEIIYLKTSADANTFTLNGCKNGPQTLTAQYSVVRIKSDGSSWLAMPSGAGLPGPPGPPGPASPPNFTDFTPQVDGATDTFTLPAVPVQLIVVSDGFHLIPNRGFTHTGPTIVLTDKPVTSLGVWYW